MSGAARRLVHRRVYEGRVLSLDVDEVEEPGGVRATREVVRHRGSVAALPVHDDGRVVLVRQYRYPVDALVWELPAGRLEPGESVEDAAGREMEEEVGLRPGRLALVRQYRYAVDAVLWELPAGRLDPGEAPAEAVRRELEEEAGLQAGDLEVLAVFHTTPGFCDETIHVYRATALTAVAARPEADERIETVWFSREDARAAAGRGEIRDAKTLVALLLEERRAREGR